MRVFPSMASFRNKALPLLLGLAAVTGGGLAAWQQHTHTLALEALRLEAQRTSDELRAKLDAAAAKNRALQAQLAEARSASSPPAAGAPGAAPGELPPPLPRDGEGDRRGRDMAAFFQRPDVARLHEIQQRGSLDYRYAGLFRQLKLNPEVLSRFQALLLDKQNTRRDINMVAREQGLNPRENREQIRALTEETNREIDQQIANLLSAEEYAAYNNYEQTSPQRDVLSRIDQRLGYTASTLTPAQSSALINAMRTQQASASTQANASTRQDRTPMAGLTEEVVTQAQAYLTAEQVATLRQYLQEVNAQRQLQQLMQENRAEPRAVRPSDPGGTLIPGADLTR